MNVTRYALAGIMINDRGWGNKDTCDYSTPEREVPPGSRFPRPTEACELVVMPGRWKEARRTLHVKNIASAKHADESLVVRLDFQP